MNEEILRLKEKAEEYKFLYQRGKCTREEAEENIMPYINLVNEKSKELAKKYNKRWKKVGFAGFTR